MCIRDRYTAANGGTQITKDTKVEVTSDQTIYAHWTANSYEVTFNADGGTVTANTKTVTFGNAYGELPTPTRSGYTFAGWWTAVDSGDVYKRQVLMHILKIKKRISK